MLGYFLCIVSSSTYGMKRPLPNNSLDLALPTHQSMEPTLKKVKLTPPEQFTDPTIFTPAEQQNRIIVAHLNNALMYLGNAQQAVALSNNKLALRISQMHKEVAHAGNYIVLLNNYQSHIDRLFEQMERTRNYLAHYLENTKEHVVDTTFSVAFSNQTSDRTPNLLPSALSTIIDIETSDEPTIENQETPLEAEAVYTAIVAPQRSSRGKNKKQPLQTIEVER
jgi:hypothetical protein